MSIRIMPASRYTSLWKGAVLGCAIHGSLLGLRPQSQQPATFMSVSPAAVSPFVFPFLFFAVGGRPVDLSRRF